MQMHDIVRDLMRQRVGDDNAMREKRGLLSRPSSLHIRHRLFGGQCGSTVRSKCSPDTRDRGIVGRPADRQRRAGLADASDDVMSDPIMRCVAQALASPNC